MLPTEARSRISGELWKATLWNTHTSLLINTSLEGRSHRKQ
jgi:hypothetical protein